MQCTSRVGLVNRLGSNAQCLGCRSLRRVRNASYDNRLHAKVLSCAAKIAAGGDRVNRDYAAHASHRRKFDTSSTVVTASSHSIHSSIHRATRTVALKLDDTIRDMLDSVSSLNCGSLNCIVLTPNRFRQDHQSRHCLSPRDASGGRFYQLK